MTEEELFDLLMKSFTDMEFRCEFIYENHFGAAQIVIPRTNMHYKTLVINLAYPRRHYSEFLLDLLHEFAHVMHHYPRAVKAPDSRDEYFRNEVIVERAAFGALKHFLAGAVDPQVLLSSQDYVMRNGGPRYNTAIYSRTYRLKKKMIAYLEGCLATAK